MGVYSEMAADLRDDVQERTTAVQDAAELAARRADERQQAEEEQAKALLSLKNPLDYLYQEWLEYDDSVLDTLRLSNDFAIDKQIEYLKLRAEKERECR